MSWLRQIVAVSLLSIRTIPQRLGSSAVAIVGIAGVVIVFVSVLSMAEGFFAALRSAGSPNRALVMRSGTDSEMTSILSGAEVEIIKQAPGLLRDNQHALASGELLVLIDLPKLSTGSEANVPLRGIEPETLKVRDEAKLVEGRMFRFGTNEVIAGRSASRHFAGLSLGSEVKTGQVGWTVVGFFETGGSVSETELWCDARVLQGVYRRGNSYQSVLARLTSPESFNTFKDWLTANPQVNISVNPEVEYYTEQSTTITTLIRTIGFGIAALMGIGAIFGAVLTMYTAVATRTREIATLRALGFNTFSVLLSVLAESLGLAAVGGVLGGLLAYFAFNGFQASTMNWRTFSQVAFAFAVTPSLLVQGVAYALIMGFIGGLLPAVKAARLPISSALREL
jgi:putative ABC transport system permease protein